MHCFWLEKHHVDWDLRSDAMVKPFIFWHDIFLTTKNSFVYSTSQDHISTSNDPNLLILKSCIQLYFCFCSVRSHLCWKWKVRKVEGF
jgi:hypothetical protein